MTDSILIVDFGSQVTQLIARRVREAGVFSEIVPYDKAGEAFTRLAPKGVIFSGGPSSVYWTDAPKAPANILASSVPILGICYGNQTLVAQSGGAVEGGHDAEFGRAEIEVVDDCLLFKLGNRVRGTGKVGEMGTLVVEAFQKVVHSAGKSRSAMLVIDDVVRPSHLGHSSCSLFLQSYCGVVSWRAWPWSG